LFHTLTQHLPSRLPSPDPVPVRIADSLRCFNLFLIQSFFSLARLSGRSVPFLPAWPGPLNWNCSPPVACPIFANGHGSKSLFTLAPLFASVPFAPPSPPRSFLRSPLDYPPRLLLPSCFGFHLGEVIYFPFFPHLLRAPDRPASPLPDHGYSESSSSPDSFLFFCFSTPRNPRRP